MVRIMTSALVHTAAAGFLLPGLLLFGGTLPPSPAAGVSLAGGLTGNSTPAPDAPDEDADEEGGQDNAVQEGDAQVETLQESLPETADETAQIEVDASAAVVVGVTWESPADDGEELEVEIRTRIDGQWGPWEEMHFADSGPDPDSEEHRTARPATEAYNVSGAEAVEIREAGSAPGEVAGQVTVSQTEITETDRAVTEGTGLNALIQDGLVAEAEDVDALTVNAPRIITRAGWGANESLRRCDPDISSQAPLGVTIHHTAGSNTYTEAAVPGILRGILNHHTQGNGWCDVGYNFLVDRFGNVYEGRSGGINEPVIGAHAGGFNARTVGVSVLGTFTSSAPVAARNAVARIAAWKADQFGMDPTGQVTITSNGSTRYPSGQEVRLPTIFGHRDVSTTECPGNAFYPQLGSIRTAAAQILQDERYPVVGAIRNYLNANAQARAKLGAPVEAERRLPDGGAVQTFQGGSVHWTQATGAYGTWGGIRNRWRDLSWERGPLGYPTSNERCGLKDGGCVQDFQGGSIHWKQGVGAHPTWGGIRNKWRDVGWENSNLGYPVRAEICGLRGNGCYQRFEGGDIHWSPSTGAHPTWGGIRTAWGSQGYEGGRLGYPTSDEYVRDGRTWQDFQGGRISWRSGQGTQIHYN